jgi:hypothetical protein
MKVFVRKYTHARIGGFISGNVQKRAEKMGKRDKGGANLRDKLYIVAAQSTSKQGMRMDKGQPKRRKEIKSGQKSNDQGRKKRKTRQQSQTRGRKK